LLPLYENMKQYCRTYSSCIHQWIRNIF